MPGSITRRQLALGSAGLAAQPKFEYLDAETAREIEALASRIIPSDDSPGAREAGAIHFIDHALAGWDSASREAYRAGLAETQRVRREMFPESTSLAGLDAARLDRVVAAIEKTAFFEVLRRHTILGFVGPPSYGGNRGEVGWAHIGVEHRMSFEPPFGYYDAEERKR